jgi:hypothetical protein
MNRFARDAAEDHANARERLSVRMGPAALDLRRCVAARDQAGIAILLHRNARTVPEKHAVAIILADLLNAALGLPATPDSVAEVAKFRTAATRRAA